jgi:beta-N-acetylhexosaminidase
MLSTAAIGLLALAVQIGLPLSETDDAATTPSAALLAGDLSPADALWIEESLGAMTLREKVAQLVVPYIDGGRPAAGSAAHRRARRLVTEDRVGGFIVGVGASRETVRWLNELQGWSRVPLLMTADLEWGAGTRLRGATLLPINMALAAAGEPELAYQAGRITGLEARAAGLHLAYAPVADVNVNPLNPVINTRAYGSDPARVSARVAAFIRGARSAGLQTVAKHFPGHGDTETDSHLALAVLGADRARLDAVELAPFRAAVAAGVDGIMTAHMAVPALDPLAGMWPATLSAPILTGLLRGELGFGGLVVTDGLHMDGVKGVGGAAEVAVGALLAGADVLLMPTDAARAIDGVVDAVGRGVLTESRIEASARRVLESKARAGLRTGAAVALASLDAALGRAEHAAWAETVAERSITLVRGEPGALPLAVRGRMVLALLYDDRPNHRWGEALGEALGGAGAALVTMRLSRASGEVDLERARRLASTSDVVLFASFSRALPWKGGLGLPEGVAALADDLAAAGAPVLSFGDPYLLGQIPSARTYLLAWSEADTSQRAAARALLGQIPVTGRLPIDLPPAYPVGHGLVLPALPRVGTLRAP